MVSSQVIVIISITIVLQAARLQTVAVHFTLDKEKPGKDSY